MKKVLFILANKDFQDTEFNVPKEILQKNGFEIIIAAGQKGVCQGKFGLRIEASLSLPEVKGKDYEAIIFVGGPGTAEEYQGNADYLRISKEAKILAAICIAPMLISDSGAFKGKEITSWDNGLGTQKKHIEKNGGIFINQNVVIDNHIITANGPIAAKKFGQEILKKLEGI